MYPLPATSLFYNTFDFDLGEIELDQTRNNDFEDLAVTSGDDGNYIYVGDIGNNLGNHCMGYNQSNRMIHIFKEPDLEEYHRCLLE